MKKLKRDSLFDPFESCEELKLMKAEIEACQKREEAFNKNEVKSLELEERRLFMSRAEWKVMSDFERKSRKSDMLSLMHYLASVVS